MTWRRRVGALAAVAVLVAGCGDSMDAHKGLKITGVDFNALVEDPVKSLDKFRVPAQEKGEPLTALSSMKGDIVNQ